MAELNLDLVVQEAPGVASRMRRGERATLRFRAVENMPQLELLLLRRRLKPVGEFVDQIMSIERASTGWTLRFRRAGRVPVNTQYEPALVRGEAG
jgi:hypothetical protein